MMRRWVARGCLVAVTALSLGFASTQPTGHSVFSAGTVTVDEMTVPDIGLLPTVVPVPATNLNYKAKVELGRQLYFDGRLSKNKEKADLVAFLKALTGEPITFKMPTLPK